MSFSTGNGEHTHGDLPPAWVQTAQAALIEEKRQQTARARARAAALVSVAQRRRDPLGKFLRSKPAKRIAREGREKLHCSMPIQLSELISTEALDAKITLSRMLVVLCALGLPAWHELRERYLTGTKGDISMIPEMVRTILDTAVNPTPRKPTKDTAAWRAQVERALQASKPKRSRPKDTTAAVLAGLGGGEGV